MPMFACFRGGAAHLALTRAGFFEVTDARGRLWVCHEATTQELCSDDVQIEVFGAALATGAPDTTYRGVQGERDQLHALLARDDGDFRYFNPDGALPWPPDLAP